jgi:hypothetical protein
VDTSDSTGSLTRCVECGTPLPSGTECRSLFDALLALEWQVPGASGDETHFLSVTSYILQHPEGMGYRADALGTMRTLFQQIVESNAGLPDVRRRMREQFDGAARVLRTPHDTVPTWPGVAWSLTVRDVLDGGAGPYRENVRRWARSVMASLRASGA